MRRPTNQEYSKIRKTIIKKLYAKRAWGKGHLLFERFQSGIPKHLYGFVKVILDDLVKEGLVIYYGPTKYGKAYHLNINKKQEIEKVIFGSAEKR